MVPFSLVPWLASFVRRPKLKVEYTPLDGMSFAGPHPGMLTVRWNYRLTITNLSNEDALELAVIRTNDPGLESLGAHHIKGLEALVVERRLEKAIPKDVVVAAQHKFHGALEPSELKELAVLLRYKSSNGVTRPPTTCGAGANRRTLGPSESPNERDDKPLRSLAAVPNWP